LNPLGWAATILTGIAAVGNYLPTLMYKAYDGFVSLFSTENMTALWDNFSSMAVSCFEKTVEFLGKGLYGIGLVFESLMYTGINALGNGLRAIIKAVTLGAVDIGRFEYKSSGYVAYEQQKKANEMQARLDEQREEQRSLGWHGQAHHPEGPIAGQKRDQHDRPQAKGQVQVQCQDDQEGPGDAQCHHGLLDHQVRGPGLVPEVEVVQGRRRVEARPEGQHDERVLPPLGNQLGQADHRDRPQRSRDEVLDRRQTPVHVQIGEQGRDRHRQKAGAEPPEQAGRHLLRLEAEGEGDEDDAHEDQEAAVAVAPSGSRAQNVLLGWGEFHSADMVAAQHA
jgi:hypothetical protein